MSMSVFDLVPKHELKTQLYMAMEAADPADTFISSVPKSVTSLNRFQRITLK